MANEIGSGAGASISHFTSGGTAAAGPQPQGGSSRRGRAVGFGETIGWCALGAPGLVGWGWSARRAPDLVVAWGAASGAAQSGWRFTVRGLWRRRVPVANEIASSAGTTISHVTSGGTAPAGPQPQGGSLWRGRTVGFGETIGWCALGAPGLVGWGWSALGAPGLVVSGRGGRGPVRVAVRGLWRSTVRVAVRLRGRGG
jgi:hypothetical protein